MTALSPWLTAALADAEAAQRDDGWLTVPELERAGHEPQDADHIARWSPANVQLVLAVLRTADALPGPIFTNEYQDQECVYCGEEADGWGNITHLPTCEWHMVREALAALAAAQP